MRSAAYKAKFRIGLREYVRNRTVSKKARRNIDCARMMLRHGSNVKPKPTCRFGRRDRVY
jgi:hypothetical protein